MIEITETMNGFSILSTTELTSDHVTAIKALDGVASAVLVNRYKVTVFKGDLFQSQVVEALPMQRPLLAMRGRAGRRPVR